ASKMEMSSFSDGIETLVDDFYEPTIDLLESNWLKNDPLQYGDETAQMNELQRNRELAEIRQQLVPHLILRLHHTLYDTCAIIPSNLQRVLDLVNLVANEEYQHYREFITPTGNRLGDYLLQVEVDCGTEDEDGVGNEFDAQDWTANEGWRKAPLSASAAFDLGWCSGRGLVSFCWPTSSISDQQPFSTTLYKGLRMEEGEFSADCTAAFLFLDRPTSSIFVPQPSPSSAGSSTSQLHFPFHSAPDGLSQLQSITPTVLNPIHHPTHSPSPHQTQSRGRKPLPTIPTVSPRPTLAPRKSLPSLPTTKSIKIVPSLLGSAAEKITLVAKGKERADFEVRESPPLYLSDGRDDLRAEKHALGVAEVEGAGVGDGGEGKEGVRQVDGADTREEVDESEDAKEEAPTAKNPVVEDPGDLWEPNSAGRLAHASDESARTTGATSQSETLDSTAPPKREATLLTNRTLSPLDPLLIATGDSEVNPGDAPSPATPTDISMAPSYASQNLSERSSSPDGQRREQHHELKVDPYATLKENWRNGAYRSPSSPREGWVPSCESTSALSSSQDDNAEEEAYSHISLQSASNMDTSRRPSLSSSLRPRLSPADLFDEAEEDAVPTYTSTSAVGPASNVPPTSNTPHFDSNNSQPLSRSQQPSSSDSYSFRTAPSRPLAPVRAQTYTPPPPMMFDHQNPLAASNGSRHNSNASPPQRNLSSSFRGMSLGPPAAGSGAFYSGGVALALASEHARYESVPSANLSTASVSESPSEEAPSQTSFTIPPDDEYLPITRPTRSSTINWSHGLPSPNSFSQSNPASQPRPSALNSSGLPSNPLYAGGGVQHASMPPHPTGAVPYYLPPGTFIPHQPQIINGQRVAFYAPATPSPYSPTFTRYSPSLAPTSTPPGSQRQSSPAPQSPTQSQSSSASYFPSSSTNPPSQPNSPRTPSTRAPSAMSQRTAVLAVDQLPPSPQPPRSGYAGYTQPTSPPPFERERMEEVSAPGLDETVPKPTPSRTSERPSIATTVGTVGTRKKSFWNWRRKEESRVEKVGEEERLN
ncbi:hypothetical protein P7C70_g1684, partial [Phenoliferia sp. Uapishka_3]